MFGALVVAATAFVGCGGSRFDGTSMTIEIYSSLDASMTNAFYVAMSDQNGNCPLSPNATLAINGTTSPFGSCTGASDSFEGNPTFVLQAADGGDQARMDVADLVPGIDATIVSPAGGQVGPGGSLTLSLPPALRGQVPQVARFTNTNAGDAYAGEITYPTSTAASSDGQTVEISAPQHAATYALKVQLWGGATDSGSQVISANVLSCKGFTHCYAQALDQLGPLQVTVTP